MELPGGGDIQRKNLPEKPWAGQGIPSGRACMNEQRHEVSFSRANGGMSVYGLRSS